MGWIKKIGLGLGGITVLGALGGYVWFWGAPVGVNNYINKASLKTVSYTHLRAHETEADLVCRLLLEKKKPQ